MQAWGRGSKAPPLCFSLNPVRTIEGALWDHRLGRAHPLPHPRGRLPDKIVGAVHAKDVMRTLEDEGNLRALRAQVRADDVIREVLTVPENRRVDAVLQNLQDRRLRMAIVIHEWGSFEGIITMEDIVGEIRDEFNEEGPRRQRAPTRPLLHARRHPDPGVEQCIWLGVPERGLLDRGQPRLRVPGTRLKGRRRGAPRRAPVARGRGRRLPGRRPKGTRVARRKGRVLGGR